MKIHPYLYIGLPKTISKFSLGTLLHHVATKLNIEVKYLKSKSRDERLVRARAIYCYLAREYNYSLKKIGKEIKRHHATVLHAIKIVENRDFDFKIKKDFEKCIINGN